MARLFKVEVSTAAKREVSVLAESAEEASAKVQPTLAEGEVLGEVTDQGEVLV